MRDFREETRMSIYTCNSIATRWCPRTDLKGDCDGNNRKMNSTGKPSMGHVVLQHRPNHWTGHEGARGERPCTRAPHVARDRNDDHAPVQPTSETATGMWRTYSFSVAVNQAYRKGRRSKAMRNAKRGKKETKRTQGRGPHGPHDDKPHGHKPHDPPYYVPDDQRPPDE